MTPRLPLRTLTASEPRVDVGLLAGSVNKNGRPVWQPGSLHRLHTIACPSCLDTSVRD